MGIGYLRGGSSYSGKPILGGKLCQWGKFSPARKTREVLIWRVLSPKGRSYLAGVGSHLKWLKALTWE